MDADWSVELGNDDPALEFPWSSPDGSQRFVDLSLHPGSVDKIPEAQHYPELAELLLAANAPGSPWITAKCDVWLERELGEAERIYDAGMKMCSYIDLIRRNKAEPFSFELHENFVKQTSSALQRTPEAPMSCELSVRRCWYHCESEPSSDPDPGFYITVYPCGYGNDEASARQSWSGALARIASVITSPQV